MKEKLKSAFSKKYLKYWIGSLLFILLIWMSFSPKTLTAETAKIARGTLYHYVEEEGTSRVREKFTLYSPVSGVLKRIEFHSGDTVKKGAVVASVDWDYKRDVVSPINGKILQIHRESSGPIEMGSPIIDIGDTANQEIVAEVLTQEAVHINTGNPVKIDGWGGDPIEGTVRLVEPEAFKKVSSLGVEEQRVRVLIDFKTPEHMGEGFKTLCRIQTGKEENRLLVPTSALFREGENWALFKVIAHKAKKTVIKVESRSGSSASVTEGLAEGDEVILFPGEGIKDGVKIQ